MRKVCVVGASGKLGRYLVPRCLERGHPALGVCRAQSVAKLDGFKGRIASVSGATDDRAAGG
jgi:nucleoside-diphosphate-sugar epimerase